MSDAVTARATAPIKRALPHRPARSLRAPAQAASFESDLGGNEEYEEKRPSPTQQCACHVPRPLITLGADIEHGALGRSTVELLQRATLDELVDAALRNSKAR